LGEQIVIPDPVGMSPDVRAQAAGAHHTNDRALASARVLDVERIGFAVNAADYVLDRPSPVASGVTYVSDVFVAPVRDGFGNTGDSNICHSDSLMVNFCRVRIETQVLISDGCDG
jgi:hypothetical protein